MAELAGDLLVGVAFAGHAQGDEGAVVGRVDRAGEMGLADRGGVELPGCAAGVEYPSDRGLDGVGVVGGQDQG